LALQETYSVQMRCPSGVVWQRRFGDRNAGSWRLRARARPERREPSDLQSWFCRGTRARLFPRGCKPGASFKGQNVNPA